MDEHPSLIISENKFLMLKFLKFNPQIVINYWYLKNGI